MKNCEKKTLCYCVCYENKVELNAKNGRFEVFYNKEDAEKEKDSIQKETGNYIYTVKEFYLLKNNEND